MLDRNHALSQAHRLPPTCPAVQPFAQRLFEDRTPPPHFSADFRPATATTPIHAASANLVPARLVGRTRRLARLVPLRCASSSPRSSRRAFAHAHFTGSFPCASSAGVAGLAGRPRAGERALAFGPECAGFARATIRPILVYGLQSTLHGVSTQLDTIAELNDE